MIEYVNFKGERVDTSIEKHAKPKPAKDEEPRWYGFKVHGFPPDQVTDAVDDHKKKADGTEFDLAAFMKTTKRTVAKSKPYTLKDSAETCADMLRKAGWIGVEVVEVVRGKK